MVGLGILQIEYPRGVVEVAGVKRVHRDYFFCFHKKMEFPVKAFFSKCEQTRRKLPICSIC